MLTLYLGRSPSALGRERKESASAAGPRISDPEYIEDVYSSSRGGPRARFGAPTVGRRNAWSSTSRIFRTQALPHAGPQGFLLSRPRLWQGISGRQCDGHAQGQRSQQFEVKATATVSARKTTRWGSCLPFDGTPYVHCLWPGRTGEGRVGPLNPLPLPAGFPSAGAMDVCCISTPRPPYSSTWRGSTE